MRNSVRNFESPYFGLGWWAGWFAFFDYFERLDISTNDYRRFREWVKTGIWETLWFEDLCVVVCRPSVIKKNSNDQLHCTNGPAAMWPSGETYWFLNGINVKEKIVLHPEKLTKEEIFGEMNVDVRREMLRQIGMDRFVMLTKPKILDKQGHYELLSIDLSDSLKDCRYLKMKNPSIGTFHVEGVERECETVDQAINWRAGDIKKQWKPIQLT